MRRAFFVVPCVVLMAVIVSACGSGGSSTSSSSTSGSETSASSGSEGTTANAASSGEGDAYLTKIDEEVEGFYEGSNFGEPTESSKPAKGKNLYIIECGAQVRVCSLPSEEAQEAAKKLGWSTHAIDAKYNPANFAPAIETAIAGGADAIMLTSIDCELVKPQLEKARKAGIVIGAMYSTDCPEPLFNAPMVLGTDPSWATQVAKYEADRMKVVIAETEGEAKVLDFNLDTLPITKVIREAGEKDSKRVKSAN